MKISRRDFCTAMTAAAAISASGAAKKTAGDIDPSLSVFVADVHVPEGRWWSHRLFDRVVNEILAMRPLPRNVVVFGDLALYWGVKSDYQGSKPYLKRLADAGIELTIGMGNHDRRSAFLEVWPEYAGRTLVPGRIVTRTDLGHADLLMLDGLQGKDDRGERDCGPSRGVLDAAQQQWLVSELSSLKRPTFLGSHYPIDDFTVNGKPFKKLILEYPLVAGYIHGHVHTASSHWTGDKKRFIRTLCLPSASMDTDLGYVVFKTSPKEATAKLRMYDFLFPILGRNDPRPEGWDEIVRDKDGRVCTFRLPSS
jgi:hypothetical protein